MRRRTSYSRRALTLLVVGGSAAVLAAVTPASASNGHSSATVQRASINTYPAWDGARMGTGFGCPTYSTFGQVVTIPSGKGHLTRFAFSWINLDGGSLVARGEVYAWDGTKATGPAIFESAPRTFDFDDGHFHKESFTVPSTAVVPGAQYVVFASIDKDFDQCRQGSYLGWGIVSDDNYQPGTFVFLKSHGHSNQWTKQSWRTAGVDLAFKVFLAA